MNETRAFVVDRIAALRLNVRDLAAMRAFYVEALGFEPAGPEASDGVVLRLGAQTLQLVRTEGEAYPAPMSANDPWFQHFAIAVSDMPAAYARLCGHGQVPISRGGPQRLPASSGSVTAYKFRDPEGHPLELSYIPGSAWLDAPSPGPIPGSSPGSSPGSAPGSSLGGPFLGIDHTALAVADLEASVAFYAGLGFRPRDRLLNQGPEQDRLDGLDGVSLHIVTLFAAGGGPHIELLAYAAPAPPPPRARNPGDIVSTLTVLQASGRRPEEGRDPDGHQLAFAGQADGAAGETSGGP